MKISINDILDTLELYHMAGMQPFLESLENDLRRITLSIIIEAGLDNKDSFDLTDFPLEVRGQMLDNDALINLKRLIQFINTEPRTDIKSIVRDTPSVYQMNFNEPLTLYVPFKSENHSKLDRLKVNLGLENYFDYEAEYVASFEGRLLSKTIDSLTKWVNHEIDDTVSFGPTLNEFVKEADFLNLKNVIDNLDDYLSSELIQSETIDNSYTEFLTLTAFRYIINYGVKKNHKKLSYIKSTISLYNYIKENLNDSKEVLDDFRDGGYFGMQDITEATYHVDLMLTHYNVSPRKMLIDTLGEKYLDIGTLEPSLFIVTADDDRYAFNLAFILCQTIRPDIKLNVDIRPMDSIYDLYKNMGQSRNKNLVMYMAKELKLKTKYV